MKNFNLQRLVVTLLFSFLSMFQSVSSARPSQALINQLRNQGSALPALPATNNGIVVDTMERVPCSSGSGVCYGRVFRDSQTVISRDSQTLRVGNIDVLPTPALSVAPRGPTERNSARQPEKRESPKRIQFSVSTVPSGPKPPKSASGTPGELEMLPPLDMVIHPNSEFYDEIASALPGLTSGVLNSLQNIQQSAAVAARLQEGYQRSLDGIRSANDHLVEGAQKQEARGQDTSNHFRILAAAAMARPSEDGTQTEDYEAYVRTAQDSMSFREYELIGSSRTEMLRAASEAVQNQERNKALKMSQMLLQQKDKALRLQAEKDLEFAFRDGVLRTSAFGGDKPSVLDAANFRTPAHSPAGQVVRYLANKAQLAWMDTRGLQAMPHERAEAYTAALIALRATDDHFMRGESEAGYSLAAVTDTLLNFSRGFYEGGSKGFKEALTALPEIGRAFVNYAELAMTNPQAAGEKLSQFVTDLPGMAESILVHYGTLGEKVLKGTAEERGEALGELGSEVIMTLITEGAGAAVKGSSVAMRGSKVMDAAKQFGKAAVAPVQTLSRELGPARVRAITTLASNRRALAVDVLKARRALEKTGAADAYLDAVLATNRPATAAIKSTEAITEAVNSGVIKTAEQIQFAKTLKAGLDQAPHQLNIRHVGNNGKVVVIGRSMETNVLPMTKMLNQHGVKAEAFSLSDTAKREWAAWKEQYPHLNIPDEVQKTGIGFQENKKWVQSRKDAGYTFVDANNPGNASPSIYYEMEHEMLRSDKVKPESFMKE